MFYLETKDGDRFFTNVGSDDKLEFEKIIEAKLGKDAVEMLDNLIHDAECINDYTLLDLKDTLDNLDKALDRQELNRDELVDILSELQSIYHQLK